MVMLLERETYIQDLLLGFLCDGTVKVLPILEVIVIHNQNLIRRIVLDNQKIRSQ